jgi:hypothetical protein
MHLHFQESTNRRTVNGYGLARSTLPAARAVRGRFSWAAVGIFCASLLGPSLVHGASAQSEQVSAAALSGRTLSAVAYVSRATAATSQQTSGGLTRLMFQAYLRPDGTALVRVWDVAADAYTSPAESRWTTTGTQLCLAVPPTVTQTLCLDVHVWGPRIAGASVTPYAMLDGDLKQGNLLAVEH